MDNIRLVRRFRGALMALVLLLPLGASATDPYPLEYFALRSSVSNVTVSPDGKRVAMLRILSREGDPMLHVYDIDDLDGDPEHAQEEPLPEHQQAGEQVEQARSDPDQAAPPRGQGRHQGGTRGPAHVR